LKRQILIALTAAAAFTARPAVAGAPPPAARDLRVERVVMLFRHGVRTPLPGEAAESLAAQPWPSWSSPPSYLTAHGQAAMRQLGVYDRARFAAEGLLPRNGCPRPKVVEIWTNTAERTISSGEALAEGLAPGCGLKVGHLDGDAKDPLFEPYEAGAVTMDPSTAIAAIAAATGGADRLIAPYSRPLATLQTILGCGPAPQTPTCDLIHQPGDIRISGDGKGMDLIGPINPAGGTAEVLLMQYAEGFPLDQVGWGRTSAVRLAEVSRLHALTFGVYARPRYMAARLAGPLARRVLQRLTARSGPRLVLLVGHDDNIAALASLAGVHFKAPGYGEDDPPMGGALGFERLADRRTGVLYVKAFYQAQTLEQLRALTPFTGRIHPWIKALPLRHCLHRGARLCPLDDFAHLLTRRSSP
jgi:4-phytase/acid phosphatase